MSHIGVIITAHKEAELLYATFKSAQVSIQRLTSVHSNVKISVTIYLDKPNTQTVAVAKDLADTFEINVIEGQNGDPGQARMDAIRNVDCDYVALLDGDDLWSENWLKKCWDYTVSKKYTPTSKFVLHPEYNLIFGAHNVLVRQGDAESKMFDPSFLRVANYWDALCFAPKTVFLDIPFKKNDLEFGFAHEDYLWMCETLSNDIPHYIMSNAIHFKRRRPGTVSQVAESKKVKVKLNKFSTFNRC
jgi:glycosyltransferase involved in cell wall biosynthesis